MDVHSVGVYDVSIHDVGVVGVRIHNMGVQKTCLVFTRKKLNIWMSLSEKHANFSLFYVTEQFLTHLTMFAG
jgi:hypothetical protein